MHMVVRIQKLLPGSVGGAQLTVKIQYYHASPSQVDLGNADNFRILFLYKILFSMCILLEM